MPSEHRVIAAFRGSEEYEAFVDRLMKAVGAGNRNDLIERALALAAKAHRIRPPGRTTAPGWSRRPKVEPAPKPKRQPKGKGAR